MSTVVCWFQRTLKQLEREQTDTQTHRHTDTQTHKTSTVTLAHARRGARRGLTSYLGGDKGLRVYPCIPGIYTQDSLFVTRVTKPQKTTLYGNTHSWQLNKLSQHQQHQLCGYYPRRACARVTVVALFVYLSVRLLPL